MLEFAERVGWKMHKNDEEVQEFCNEMGVDRTVLRVWMHNNKNTFGKKESLGNEKINLESNGNNGGGEEAEENNTARGGGGGGVATANGSSSSS